VKAMKKRWLGVPILLVFILAACTSTPDKTSQQQPVEQLTAEETMFKNNCATCHGGNLEGGFGPTLQHVGKNYSKDQILAIIKNGKGSMPSQSFIPQADQEKLAVWLANKK
jgi:cytochrome c551